MAKAKILKSRYAKENELLWNSFKIVDLPILSIWPTAPNCSVLVGKPFKKNLIEDIDKNGMYFPIMVVKTNGYELIRQKQKYVDKINPLPFWQTNAKECAQMYWSCWGGSQRLDVAIRLGFTHISCAVLPDIDTAIKHQRVMRQPYIKKYYEE